jgi:hypothetical protein
MIVLSVGIPAAFSRVFPPLGQGATAPWLFIDTGTGKIATAF